MSHSVQLVSEVHNLKHSVWRYAVGVWKSRYESGARNKAVGSHPSPIPGAIDASVSAQLGGFCLLQACIHDLDLFFSANIAAGGIVIKLNSIMLLPLLKSLGNSSHTSGFPGGSLSKVSAFSVGDPGSAQRISENVGDTSIRHILWDSPNSVSGTLLSIDLPICFFRFMYVCMYLTISVSVHILQIFYSSLQPGKQW